MTQPTTPPAAALSRPRGRPTGSGRGPTVRADLRLRADLMAKADRMASAAGLSRNAWIEGCIEAMEPSAAVEWRPQP